MNWNGIKVAYVPHHKDLVVPGDRRRFAFYASARNIPFEIADYSKIYDVVYLTYGCDLSAWIKYKKINPSVKIIFELIDSYLLEDLSRLTIFRGLARYFLGKESSLWFYHKNALRKIISVADVVVCSTREQMYNITNKNIHLSLDYFSNDINQHKCSLASNNKLKLVWEGQAHTVKNLFLLNDIFEKLGDKVELYIITDLVIKSPLKVLNRKTNNILSKLKCKYHLIEWDISTFSYYISNADLAIIPIESNNSMMWNKPENKLLLFWEIGLPTLTSPTPSYKRVMDVAGLDFCCSSSDEWIRKIEEYMESSIEYRKEIMKKTKNYLYEYHTKNKILARWDSIFDSLQMELSN